MSGSIEIGSYVLYGKTGVCLVKELTTLSHSGSTAAEYYVLLPISDNRTSVYVPRSNPDLVARMCPLLSRTEIDALLAGAGDDVMQWVDDRQQRGTLYRAVINGNDRRALIRLIRCLYTRKEVRQAAGKRLSSMDENALLECVRLVEEEFSIVLGIPTADVEAYVRKHIRLK